MYLERLKGFVAGLFLGGGIAFVFFGVVTGGILK